MKSNKRIGWIDISRACAMFLVVWLHFGSPRIINQYVHLFHMPVFFFVSGICNKSGKFKNVLDLLKNKSKAFLFLIS